MMDYVPDFADEAIMRADLVNKIRELDNTSKKVIYYIDYLDFNQEETAQKLNLSRMQVQRIRAKALDYLNEG